MNSEVALASGYAVALIAGAFILEWLSAHTHRRSLRYRTAGFTYDPQHDNWECPEGETLWPHEFDRERRLVRYRAKPQICNACPRKVDCTDSDRGREIARPVDAWPHSEAGRFHRTLSLVLVGLAIMMLVVEGVRHHAPVEALLLAAALIAGAASARWLLRDLVNHPANFPAPTAAHGLGLAVTVGDGVHAESQWSSQRDDPH